MPEDHDGKLAQAQSDKAAQKWAQLKPSSRSNNNGIGYLSSDVN